MNRWVYLSTAGDVDRAAVNLPPKTFARLFADFIHALKGQLFILGCSKNCSGKRMFGIALEIRCHPQNLVSTESGRVNHFGEDRGPVSQRAGLIEDKGCAGIYLFEPGRILDHNPAAGGERNRSND